jgi:hypothetical protein
MTSFKKFRLLFITFDVDSTIRISVYKFGTTMIYIADFVPYSFMVFSVRALAGLNFQRLFLSVIQRFIQTSFCVPFRY